MTTLLSRGTKSVKGFLNSSRMETMIGSDTILYGNLTSNETIRIDGKVEGNVTNASQVIVGEGGEIMGDINASAVVVGGQVTGNIVSHSLEILSEAKIHGDIKTASLSIAEGSIFEGNCAMIQDKDVIEIELSRTAVKGRR